MIGCHSKAVSYVRWLDGSHLVSASTDNQLKLWDLAAAGRHSRHQDWRPQNVLTGGRCMTHMCVANSLELFLICNGGENVHVSQLYYLLVWRASCLCALKMAIQLSSLMVHDKRGMFAALLICKHEGWKRAVLLAALQSCNWLDCDREQRHAHSLAQAVIACISSCMSLRPVMLQPVAGL